MLLDGERDRDWIEHFEFRACGHIVSQP